MIKRLFVLVLIFSAITGFLPAGGAKEQPASPPTAPQTTVSAEPSFKGQTLTVSTWGFNMDLINKNLTKPFEEKYGVKVLYETGNNSDRLTKLVARKDNPNIDVVHFAGNYTYLAIKEGVIQPYGTAKIPSLKDLHDWAKDPAGNQYGAGYAISAFAVAYRTDKVNPPITSWADLARPDLKGFVTLPDVTTTFGPATVVLIAKAFGGGQDNVEPAWQKLPDIAKNLVTVYRRSSELTTLVQQGEVWVAPYSSFSWGTLVATKVPLKSIVPKEGTVGSQSIVSVVKGAKNVELAHRYIDFILSHDVQKAQALDLVDSPTNKTVEVPANIADKLAYGPEILSNIIFLDEAKLAGVQSDWVKRWNAIMAK
jgi:putative spermidine/putrescine transport system substrate-binding protein